LTHFETQDEFLFQEKQYVFLLNTVEEIKNLKIGILQSMQ
jgi:hypothetical protein